MKAHLVFNELSVGTLAQDIHTGKSYLDQFARILTDQRIPSGAGLVTPPEFLQFQVSSGYSIGRWIHGYNEESGDLRRRIKVFLDKSVEYDDFCSINDLTFSDAEYTCNNYPARGLCIANISNSIAVSLLSSEQWNQAQIQIYKTWIEETTVPSIEILVPHIGKESHLDQHIDWLKRHREAQPTNGHQLWERRVDLFPSLEFCECTEDQIRRLGGDSSEFRATARGLRDLQSYCDRWSSGSFDIKALNNASGESIPTLQQFGDERTFRCPDGEDRIFDWHLKRGTFRIHFFDFPGQRKILIGYVGKHLRTVKHP
jgi:hypothetical protein